MSPGTGVAIEHCFTCPSILHSGAIAPYLYAAQPVNPAMPPGPRRVLFILSAIVLRSVGAAFLFVLAVTFRDGALDPRQPPATNFANTVLSVSAFLGTVYLLTMAVAQIMVL